MCPSPATLRSASMLTHSLNSEHTATVLRAFAQILASLRISHIPRMLGKKRIRSDFTANKGYCGIFFSMLLSSRAEDAHSAFKTFAVFLSPCKLVRWWMALKKLFLCLDSFRLHETRSMKNSRNLMRLLNPSHEFIPLCHLVPFSSYFMRFYPFLP